MIQVGIIDYGVGNLGSLQRAFEDLGAEADLITNPDDLGRCSHIVLPGVGSFTECVVLLEAGGWIAPLRTAVGNGTPVLGICVGMQLLADEGLEGAEGATPTPGLGLIAGRVVHLRDLGCQERVPHVGWNAVAPTPAGAAGFARIPEGTDVYFVHSYSFVPKDPDTITAMTTHGVPIVAAIQSGRVWGMQFHPEKSSRAGSRILRNFWESA